MVTHTPSAAFLGRSDERAWLTDLLRTAARGHGTAGVVSGAVGIGKTTLVEEALARLPELRTQLIGGVEAEADLPYGALQRMVLAHRWLLATLREEQQTALLVACGLAGGAVPSPSLVGLSVLNLLARLSADAPLACFVDDAQWIDPESLFAYAFASRRLMTEPVAMLFAGRTTGVPSALDGLPARALSGLDPADAATLLGGSTSHPLDPRVGEQIIAALDGNPLALRDLPDSLSARQLSGEEPLPEPLPIGHQLQSHYLRPTLHLPAMSRFWLLVAATEPDGNLATITAASRALGLGEDASHPAEVAGLVLVDTTVSFNHPFTRAAIYNGAPSDDGRAVHDQLAQLADRRGDLHRRAIHLAAATIGPDDDVATALEEVAGAGVRQGRTMNRTGLLLKSAALTSSAGPRQLRLLAACESAIGAGSGVQAQALLQQLNADLLDDVGRGRLIIAQCELDIVAPIPGPGVRSRAHRLLTAAKLFRPTAPDRARLAITAAFWSLVQADDLVRGTSSHEIAETAREICGSAPSSHLPTQAVVALSTLVLDGSTVAAPLVGEASRMALTAEAAEEEVLQSALCIAYAAALLRDSAASTEVLGRAEQIARGCGETLSLCRILMLAAYLDVQQGRIRAGGLRLNNAGALITFTGLPEPYARMVTSMPALRGWLGDETVTVEDALTTEARTVGYGLSLASRLIGAMLLRASQGRYVEAWETGRQVKHDDPFFVGALYLPDLIECAARAGDLDTARRLIARLEAAGGSESRWAEGLRERSLAHLAAENAATHFERAVELLTEPGHEMDCARAHLLYGEWLRRRRRRAAAAEHLSAARTGFHQLGAPTWADRAHRELAALGEYRAREPLTPSSALTAQELAVATLAKDGYTNSEIALQLFVSANTVDYHLRKVFRKLGVTSRRRLQGIDLAG